MGRIFTCLLLFATSFTPAQQPATMPAPAGAAAPDGPLPDIKQLVLDLERNQRMAEAARRDYTYHVHLEQQELDGKGGIKKATIDDSESITIGGVRVDRVVAHNHKPLTSDETKKESERIDKQVAKSKERREKLEREGKTSDSRGDEVLTASRILELGNFSNPRRSLYKGRATILADYAGNPDAKTHNAAEAMFRNLVGTVWIDEADRTLVRAEGHFLNDFKMGGGLLLNVHKGFSFNFSAVKVNSEVWLPEVIDAHGTARLLLFDKIDGNLHLVTSDYRKFRSGATIVGSSDALGPDDQPVPPDNPSIPKP
jgi:hypothetical protein